MLRQDEEFEFSRGQRDDSEIPNILLVAPTSEHPVPAILGRLEHEYSLRGQLDTRWAARPLTLVRRDGKPVLILEDVGGEPLDQLLGQPMELNRFLRFAAGLAGALGKLHQQGLIHKDIKPANLLVDSASGAVWLTGFGIASRLPRERQSAEPPETIAGTLAYMAPEQTGRMNRSIDSRSDLYSLGMTFYEMLTGVLPFSAAPPQKEWLDLNETIGEVIAMARSEIRRNRVLFQTDLANDLPLIAGDRIQLQQVILNLLINAIEAMGGVRDGLRELGVSSEKVLDIAGGSEEGTLENKALSHAEWTHVLVAVRDSGPGLDPEGIDRLFDAFYTTKSQGMGMGLAISRSIVEAHGGRLWAAANQSKGAVFQFTLPLRIERMS